MQIPIQQIRDIYQSLRMLRYTELSILGLAIEEVKTEIKCKELSKTLEEKTNVTN